MISVLSFSFFFLFSYQFPVIYLFISLSFLLVFFFLFFFPFKKKSVLSIRSTVAKCNLPIEFFFLLTLLHYHYPNCYCHSDFSVIIPTGRHAMVTECMETKVKTGGNSHHVCLLWMICPVWSRTVPDWLFQINCQTFPGRKIIKYTQFPYWWFFHYELKWSQLNTLLKGPYRYVQDPNVQEIVPQFIVLKISETFHGKWRVFMQWTND